jgi:hypothetical protein
VILNAYAVLAAFISILSFLLGLLLMVLGLAAWRQSGRDTSPEGRKHLEDRGALLFLSAFLLVGLNLVSWPLLYLLLQSYIPQLRELHQSMMCIYGVTQFGTGSDGPARFLPELLRTLQLTKPLLVFCGGAWFVLYLVNRRSQTAPILPRVLLALVVLGALAEVDAAAEAAYLVMPKREDTPDVGCCAAVFDEADRGLRLLPTGVVGEGAAPWLWAGYYGSNVALALGLFVCARRVEYRPRSGWLAVLLAGAAVAVPVAGLFLVEVAAPRLLHMPEHHCPYDLIPQVPEAMIAVALFLWGTFSVGWACVAAWAGSSPETRSFLPEQVRRLVWMAFYCYVGSLVMISVELVLVSWKDATAS